MGVDGPVVAEEVVAPDVGEQLVSGQSDVLVLHQVEKQIVFLRRQFYFLAVNGNGAGRDVDFQSVEFHDLLHWLFNAAVSGKNRVDASHQFLRAEGFYHVVVDTQFKTEELVVFSASGSRIG